MRMCAGLKSSASDSRGTSSHRKPARSSAAHKISSICVDRVWCAKSSTPDGASSRAAVSTKGCTSSASQTVSAAKTTSAAPTSAAGGGAPPVDLGHGRAAGDELNSPLQLGERLAPLREHDRGSAG